MSLHQLANHMAAHGRGPDDHLVHMSGKEVAGLQSLARAHGGSLTVNPQTGLPEAGFLDNLLPTLIGAGLAYATGGASLGAELGMAGVSNAALIGGGIGGLETLRTGNLGKGLMAGLGAYGGAGLGGAAESSGMFKGAEVPKALEYNPDFGYGGPGDVSFNQAGQVPTAPNIPTSGADYQMSPAQMSAQSPVQPAPDAGIGNLTTNAAPPPSFGDLVMQNKGYAAAAAAPAVMGMLGQQGTPPAANTGMIRPYTFAYNKQQVSNPIGATRQAGQDTSERLYFQPQYTAGTPYKAAEGGLMSFAGGGPVEQMSNQNAIGGNTGFPMADINKAAYATPYQTPINENVVQGAADTGVNSMTGDEVSFAEGGITGSGSLDLHVPLDLGGGQGGQGGSQSAYGSQGGNGGMPGFSGGQQQGFGGGLGLQTMPARMQQQDPFAGDTNWANYQQQMQGMQNDFLNSDQYKNMDQLRQTMQNYQQQRMYGPSNNYQEPELGMPKDMPQAMAAGGMAYAQGGISTLGGYSDGGRLLKGPGDGMSDNIPAQIGAKQPARLADGEFVVPADVVSHLGNGSTDAGAKQLYQMMDKIRSARTGRKAQGKQINPKKFMPA